MLKPPKPTAVVGPARRDASPAADDAIKLRQRIASLQGDDHKLPELESNIGQHSDDDHSSPVSVATPREDSADRNEPSKSLPRSDSTPHSLPTSVSYGDVIDEVRRKGNSPFCDTSVFSMRWLLIFINFVAFIFLASRVSIGSSTWICFTFVCESARNWHRLKTLPSWQYSWQRSAQVNNRT